VWLVLYGAVVAQLPSPDPLLLAVSLSYIVYYCGLSLFLEHRRRTARREALAPARALEGV
jgi:phosphatidylcholine synthase